MILALLIALTTWLLGLILPWWAVALPGLVFGALLGRSGTSAFGWGFTGIGLLWLGQTLWLHLANDGILTGRIGEMFTLPSPLLLVFITALVGGLIGGCTTLTGYLLRKLLHGT